ncbi:MAG TPA: MATE family efflux transporter [Thermoleophilia bacterium]|nr:MATE family efflux transporter [Thermoleophilia bacterium]
MRLSERDRRILALAIPALGGLAVEPLYVLVDTAIVGRLGTVPLGGLALASTTLTSLLWVFNFLSYGTTARVAFLTGRGDERRAAGVASQALWLAALIGLPLAAGVFLLARVFATVIGGHGAVLNAAVTYLRISALGMPAVLVALVGQGHLRGLSDTRTPFVVVAVANGINVVLELIFVYAIHLGIAGSAWGTVIAQLVAAAWFLGLIGRRVGATGVERRPRWGEMRELIVIGRHLFLRTAALLATLAASTSVAARLGATRLGGHQIALQIETFLALAVDALAIPGQALVGTLLGAGDVPEARATGQRLLRWGLAIGAVLAVVVVSLAGVLPHLFSGDAGVVHNATVALVFVGVMQVPASAAFVLDGSLMGASDFRFLQWATIAAGLAFVPFAVAVLHWHGLGIVGIWAGLLVWIMARAAANMVRFRGSRWVSVAHVPADM